MNSKRIKFAKEYVFCVTIDDDRTFNTGIVDFQVIQDDLFLKDIKGEFVRVAITAEITNTLSKLYSAYGKSLLRIDKIEKSNISLILLEFSAATVYEENNPLRIVIDQALSADLKINNIAQDEAVEQIKKQIIVEEEGLHCFAYANNDMNAKLEIVGDKYSFTITATPQHYLHIIQMRKRSNKSRIDAPLILINGAIEIVDELTDRAILTARANEQYAKMLATDTEFIQLWNIYNELELESIKQQAVEMGYLKYKSFKYVNGMIIFNLEGGYTHREFCGDNMYYVAVRNIDKANPMEYNPRIATIIGTEIDRSCINTPEFRIKEEMDTTRKIPERGYLLPSVSGSAVQSKRRKRAQQNILSNKCAMPGLKNIIQGGAQVGIGGRKNQPVSDALEKVIFNDPKKHFTEKQKNALDTAINTPDIAIIQGPPGTGKTTIIRAIVKRIDELWDSKAKILITSTQHDAVDNAIEEISYGGVPVNRVSVRKGKDDESLLIFDWIDGMISSCEKWIENKGGSDRSTVREIFEKLLKIETTDNYQMQYTLFKELGELLTTLNISAEANSLYGMVVSELGAIVNTKDIGISSENQLTTLLKGQRLNKIAFLDDGIIQLKQLEQWLKFESAIEFEIPSYWKKLKRITNECPELDAYLDELRKDCEILESMNPEADSVNRDLLNKDVQDLIKLLRIEIVALGNDKRTILSNLIWEFKQELTNSNNVNQLIKSYSKINAATCQQSANPFLSTSMAGFDEVYDFVIVDEAARSNPLDLLIPMSMGKKIILVGDHKQLPHMVEKDVVQAVSKKAEGKEVDSVLEESLFMRLNDSVAAEDKKLGITRTAMLCEQYRMHPDICDLVNVFYDGQLESLCKKDERAHGLNLYEGKALAWIDLPLSEKYLGEDKKQSISRQCEVECVKEELTKILAQNADYKIGVITFYSAQAKLLNEMVYKNFPGDIHRIRVGTVDAFQGKEFDAVLLSIVRSNLEEDPRKRVGFLDNNNRLCVAFSRAKRLLVAIGDSNTVAFDGEKEYVKALHEMYKKCVVQGDSI